MTVKMLRKPPLLFLNSFLKKDNSQKRFDNKMPTQKKSILIILPSKNRPEKIEGFYKSWRKTNNGRSEILACLDENDQKLGEYKIHRDISFDVGKGGSFTIVCNRAFNNYSNYQYYFIASDDHRFRTKNWEKKFINVIKKNGGKGIAYGNDLLQRKNLATSAFVSGNIFRALGFVALPNLIHMYTDSFWTEIGKQINKLFYFDEVIIENMHFSVGKSQEDKQYKSVNNKKVAEHDRKVFEEWKMTNMKKDIIKIKNFKEK